MQGIHICKICSAVKNTKRLPAIARNFLEIVKKGYIMYNSESGIRT